MNNKVVTFTLIGLVLSIFLAYFTWLNLKLNNDQDPAALLQKITEDAQEEEWRSADEKYDELYTFWSGIQYLMMLNYAEEDFNTFEEKLNRLRLAILLEDQKETSYSADEAKYYWTNMVKTIPKP